MSYAHRARKKAIKRNEWNHADAIERWHRQGRNVDSLVAKEAARGGTGP